MIRVVVENVLLFLLPTAMYIAYVLLTRRSVHGRRPSSTRRRWCGCSSPGPCWSARRSSTTPPSIPAARRAAVYTPPRMKDGRIEPGQLK